MPPMAAVAGNVSRNDNPLAAVTPLAEFLRRAQASAPMAGIVEPALYRSRKA
jgi:hypothetical protein